tara:strand:+ start:86 stop:364 length:279 start_codon:yes stop_codon:yes gene_type:complete
MPFMTNGKRDYKKELAWEKKGGKSKRADERKKRGRARTAAKLKDGDPREADHKRPFSEGGSNARSNVRIVSRKTNAKKEVARKKKVAKKGKA